MALLKGKIKKAGIVKVLDIFKKHKPRGVHLTDTEAIVLSIKAEDGREVGETFYACILPDGRINTKQMSHRATASQRRLANFISKYITPDVTRYNVKQNIRKWVGIPVELEQKGGYVFLA